MTYFLQNLDRKDTLEPLGFEGQLSEEQLRERRAARKALAQPPPKPAGCVIVVGAGAAGLAAATQLQVSCSCHGGPGTLSTSHKSGSPTSQSCRRLFRIESTSSGTARRDFLCCPACCLLATVRSCCAPACSATMLMCWCWRRATAWVGVCTPTRAQGSAHL